MEKPRRVPGLGFFSTSILENGVELIGAFGRFIFSLGSSLDCF
jgi:hypothetical protein